MFEIERYDEIDKVWKRIAVERTKDNAIERMQEEWEAMPPTVPLRVRQGEEIVATKN